MSVVKIVLPFEKLFSLSFLPLNNFHSLIIFFKYCFLFSSLGINTFSLSIMYSSNWFLVIPISKLKPNFLKNETELLLLAINLSFWSQNIRPFGKVSIPSLKRNSSFSCFFVAVMSVHKEIVLPSFNLVSVNKKDLPFENSDSLVLVPLNFFQLSIVCLICCFLVMPLLMIMTSFSYM